MQIGEMFNKDINRNIKGVIKAEQTDEETKRLELEEYVVTNQLQNRFGRFFESYNRGIISSTDDIGVWISGFFGSGKSHFLKILSYLLDSNLIVDGKKPVDFFKEGHKIDDAVILSAIDNANSVDTEVILFNIDTKSAKGDNVLDVFIKVFNAKQGYCEQVPFIADFEKELVADGKYESFIEEFNKIYKDPWEKARHKYGLLRKQIAKASSAVGFSDEETIMDYIKDGKKNYQKTIEEFAEEVEEYCRSKGRNHHVIFLVDEVGQFIADDTNLMLNLQTISENLGTHSHGKAWLIVTSQESIDNITKVQAEDGFSKIQGRFKTRLSLSSDNVDEVIKKRLLTKKPEVEERLKAMYPEKEVIIKNKLIFKDTALMKSFHDAEDFANVYPFIPYQFNLLQDVLTQVRKHGTTGKHLAEGERSMLAFFQEAAQRVGEKEEGTLVPFYLFYDSLDDFLDHNHRIVITRAQENELLSDFDVNVLKVLFLIKYVKEIKKATLENISILMLSDIDEDITELRTKVADSLRNLENQTLISKNIDVYSFLTDAEQDVNREIKNETIEQGETLTYASNLLFDLIGENKYKYNNRYSFVFNQSIDNKLIGAQKGDIGVKIISPYYDFNFSSSQSNIAEFTESEKIRNGLRNLSNEADIIVYLGNNFKAFEEIEELLKIQKYMDKNRLEVDPEIVSVKDQEVSDKRGRIEILLETTLKEAEIFIKGNKVDIAEKNATERIQEALGILVNQVYNKINYLDGYAADKSDILNEIKNYDQLEFGSAGNKAINALDDLSDYLKYQTDIHKYPTLKDIISRYRKPPYGFIELDVQWMVARLFAEKGVNLSKNGEIINLNDYKAEEILNFLTKSQYYDKILLSKRKEVSKAKVKLVMEVLDISFNKHVSTKNDEEVRNIFENESKKLLDRINAALNNFKFSSNYLYPGEETLNSSRMLILESKDKKSLEQFYDFMSSKEDEFLRLGEDTDPVLMFFEGPQKEIFERGWDVYDSYTKNQLSVIDNDELKERASKIKDIIFDPKPYSKIKNINEYCDDYELLFDEVLENKRTTPRNDINKYLNEVLSYLTSDILLDKFENKVRSDFSNLEDKLDGSHVIAVIEGVSNESRNLKSSYIKQIEEYIGSIATNTGDGDSGTGPNPPKPLIKRRTVTIKNVVNQSSFEFKSNDDIDKFVEDIRAKLKKELEGEDILDLDL